MTASERKQIADELGESEQYLYQCMTGRASMRPAKAVDLERRSAGRLTVGQLSPDVVWRRVPDPDWPHPDGRPCIDVAAPAAAMAEQGA